MANISSLTAVKFTSLAYVDTDRTDVAADLLVAFASPNEVSDVREFPSMGTPANIVNVPVYGQATSSQIGGQADAPTLEFTVNYVPTAHAKLDVLRKESTEVMWRVRLTDVDGLAVAADGSSAGQYNDIYFAGTVQSLEITPSLSDAMQATFSVSINGDFIGPMGHDGTSYAAV